MTPLQANIITGLGIAAIVVVLVVVYIWWQFRQAKQRLVDNCVKSFDVPNSVATEEAQCALDTLRRDYGFWRTLRFITNKEPMSSSLQQCLINKCALKCRPSPVSGSIDSSIRC